MGRPIKETSKIIYSMAKVFLDGQIIRCIMGNGKKTRCTVTVLLIGQMAGNMKGSLLKT